MLFICVNLFLGNDSIFDKWFSVFVIYNISLAHNSIIPGHV
jgi:hypothetical protein